MTHFPVSPGREVSGVHAFYAGIVLGAALVYVLLLACQSMLAARQAEMESLDLALLAPLATRSGEGEMTAVLLGNSRLRSAVSFGLDPSSPVLLPDGRTLRAVRYAQDVAVFGSYEKLWPAILAARPDYIIVQDSLLTADLLVKPFSLTGFSNIIYGGVETALSGKSAVAQWDEARRNIVDFCIRPEDYNAAAMQDRLIFAAHRDRHALGEVDGQTGRARTAIEQALDAGIRVAVLRLPANGAMAAKFGVPLDKIDFYGLGFSPAREQLLPDDAGRVLWLDYPAPGPASFCDFVHFNAEGRADFTRWLLSRF